MKTGLLTSLTKGSTALHTTLQRRGISLLGGILSYTGCRRVSWVDLDASLPMYINTPDTNITPPAFLHECGWAFFETSRGLWEFIPPHTTDRYCTKYMLTLSFGAQIRWTSLLCMLQ